jgi:hypothetical protein
VKHLLFATALTAIWFLMVTNRGRSGEALALVVLLVVFACGCYSLYKSTRQVVVTIDGSDVDLGKHCTAASRVAFPCNIAETVGGYLSRTRRRR